MQTSGAVGGGLGHRRLEHEALGRADGVQTDALAAPVRGHHLEEDVGGRAAAGRAGRSSRLPWSRRGHRAVLGRGSGQEPLGRRGCLGERRLGLDAAQAPRRQRAAGDPEGQAAGQVAAAQPGVQKAGSQSRRRRPPCRAPRRGTPACSSRFRKTRRRRPISPSLTIGSVPVEASWRAVELGGAGSSSPERPVIASASWRLAKRRSTAGRIARRPSSHSFAGSSLQSSEVERPAACASSNRLRRPAASLGCRKYDVTCRWRAERSSVPVDHGGLEQRDAAGRREDGAIVARGAHQRHAQARWAAPSWTATPPTSTPRAASSCST